MLLGWSSCWPHAFSTGCPYHPYVVTQSSQLVQRSAWAYDYFIA